VLHDLKLRAVKIAVSEDPAQRVEWCRW
jgi:hypothetical protein